MAERLRAVLKLLLLDWYIGRVNLDVSLQVVLVEEANSAQRTSGQVLDGLVVMYTLHMSPVL